MAPVNSETMASVNSETTPLRENEETTKNKTETGLMSEKKNSETDVGGNQMLTITIGKQELLRVLPFGQYNQKSQINKSWLSS